MTTVAFGTLSGILTGSQPALRRGHSIRVNRPEATYDFGRLTGEDTTRQSPLPFLRPDARVFVGPAFAYNTHARVGASASGGSSNVDVESQVRTTDLGFAIGGGIQGFRWSVEAPASSSELGVGGRVHEPAVTPTPDLRTEPGHHHTRTKAQRRSL